ncbi:hypothetical protein IGI04_007602 [Brassica rapa subsp. trilocularis]|uniref:Uncharacterized protein n=1 Tax=Brassica rapa subsp. trilocularis TaxID=1813537 RepID=A0ABQ7NKJ9_BRACM|nr:hypothetical protein IGI04_007602 [Brassica rapa subsp. trilocularis]
MDPFGPFSDLSIFTIYRKSASETTSIPKKVRISRIVEAVQDYIRDNEFLWFLNRKVLMVITTEMKQKQV